MVNLRGALCVEQLTGGTQEPAMHMHMGPDNSAYSIVTRPDGSFIVEITKANTVPRYAEGFSTQEEAENWVFREIERTKEGLEPYAGNPDAVPGAPGLGS
jgi:hypothetical protein